MNGQRCQRCGTYWAFSSGPHENFDIITKFCPSCLARILPVQEWGLVR